MAALQYLDSLRNTHPELADWCRKLADEYQNKLWHQLTQTLEQFVALDALQAGEALIQLYHNFITDFETKINQVKLSHLSVTVSRRYAENQGRDAAILYLEEVIERLGNAREPIVYVKMQIALYQLELGNQKESKTLLDEGKSILDSMTDIDPSVYAIHYWVVSRYHKERKEFADFYRSGLLYLAYTSSLNALSDAFKVDLAFDLSLSALLGDRIYNFGELLANPIITSLKGTNVEWIYNILEAFNTGDLGFYQQVCKNHGPEIFLVVNEEKLMEKMNILCLVETISSRAAEDRTIPLSVIAERCRLSVEDVECLVMKSLSVHLIEGIMDQLDGSVHVSWVQPRVLGIPQIRSLMDRVDNWMGKVNTALVSVEAETPDLVSS